MPLDTRGVLCRRWPCGAEARVLQVVDPNLSRQSVDYLLKSARVKVVVIRAD